MDKPEYCVGFDLGGTKMLTSVMDSQFKILSRVRKKTKGYMGGDSGIDRIVEMIKTAIAEAGIPLSKIGTIGIGCPGPVDMDKGVLISAPNMGWENMPIKKRLEDALNCKVFVTNDVDAGVYGEYRFGVAKDTRCVLGIFPGTGIGGGCVYEGKIFTGRRITCMEIGHTRIIPGGPLSSTGHEGTLEAIASRLAISTQAAQAAYRGQAPNLMKEAGTDLSQIRSGMLANAIKDGDKSIENIIKHACYNIGVSAASMIHVLAPDMIILGGGLVEAMPELFLNQISQSAREWLMPAYKNITEFKVAKLGDDAAVLGSAAWACESLTKL
jgi:glucokinase